MKKKLVLHPADSKTNCKWHFICLQFTASFNNWRYYSAFYLLPEILVPNSVIFHTQPSYSWISLVMSITCEMRDNPAHRTRGHGLLYPCKWKHTQSLSILSAWILYNWNDLQNSTLQSLSQSNSCTKCTYLVPVGLFYPHEWKHTLSLNISSAWNLCNLNHLQKLNFAIFINSK